MQRRRRNAPPIVRLSAYVLGLAALPATSLGASPSEAPPPSGSTTTTPQPPPAGTATTPQPPPAGPATTPQPPPAGSTTTAGPSAEPTSASTETDPSPTSDTEPPAAPPPPAPAAPPPSPSDASADVTTDSTAASTQPAALPATEPPRIDGTYVGLVAYGSVGLARVNMLETDGAFGGWGLYGRVGQMVLPWLGVGLQGGGGISYRSESGARQTLRQGGLMAEFNFVPAPKRLDLSLRASFGFGGGAIREEGRTDRSGFGGALFGVGVRYEFFPGVAKYRARRGGGFGLGPEIGWIGATPAAAGRPMANTFFLGLSSSFYFGD